MWFFLNHWNQRVGRCVLLNHHEWRECNDRNEWWFSRTHRPTSWLKRFRKNLTSLRWDFLLIQGLKPWIIRFDFSLIQHDFSWFRVISSWFQLIQGDFKLISVDSGWFQLIQDDFNLIPCLECDFTEGKSGITPQCDFTEGKSGITLQCDFTEGKSGITLESTEITWNQVKSHWNQLKSHWFSPFSHVSIQG